MESSYIADEVSPEGEAAPEEALDLFPATEEPGCAGGEESLLSPYRFELFVAHRGWHSLARILHGRRGGSYGLSGPRGAGKSWMMERAREQAREQGGVGVWFPSPSEYEATAFLASISDVVAAEYQDYYDDRTGRLTKVARGRFLLTISIGVLFAYSALAFLLIQMTSSTPVLPSSSLMGSLISTLVLSAGVAFILVALRRSRADREGLGLVRSQAEELRRQVRYTMSASENFEAGVSGVFSGLGANLKRAGEKQLVERPATLSSLIHNFRSFVEKMAREVEGPVVIAIDELDKMSDADRVAQLLRDIKGILEIPGAYFLVSLSDEAARALDLGAVRARNEFNSSFYTVISLGPLSPADCVELLTRRDPAFDSDCARAIGIITGGNSREVVRIAELLRAHSGVSAAAAMEVAIGEELDAFADQVLETAGGGSEIDDAARLDFFEALATIKAELAAGSVTIEKVLASWELNSGRPGWAGRMEEEWRRLLVRHAIAGLIASRPDLLRQDDKTMELQEIVKIAAASAAVGHSRLLVFQ